MNARCSRKYLMDCVLIVCAAAAVYGRLVGYGFQTHWDDNVYILNNLATQGFSWEHVRAVFGVDANMIGQYNPLSLLSFMLDYSLWGLNPAGYHLTNIFIHVLNGLLVYRLLLRLHGERLLALVVAAIFLLHPVQVESVAWISERKGLLSLFFFLLSWEGYCRYLDSGSGSGRRRGRVLYVLSLLSFLLSLLAKTASVVLPVVLIAYEWCFTNGDRRIRLLDKIPFLIISGLFSAIELYSESPDHGGSLVGYHGGSPQATLYTMLPVFCRYFRLLLWPSGLNIEHMPPVYQSLKMEVVLAAFLLSLLLYAAVRLYKIDRRLGFWAMFFWIGLLPVSQIVPLFLLMYEHYLYMPIIGVAALSGAGVVFVRDRIGARRSVMLYGALSMWLIALSVTSFQRTAVWRDTLTLFTDASLKSPQSYRVWEILGEVYYSVGHIDASRQALERCVAIKPDNVVALWGLGKLHTEAGDLEKGREYIQKLIAKDPVFAPGWETLGDNYRGRADNHTAGKMYRKALEIQPNAVQVQMKLAKLAINERRLDDARNFLYKVETDSRGWNMGENAYLMTCVESLASRTDVAITWLEKSLVRGYRNYASLNTNMELSSLWDDPRFYVLMLKYFPEQENRIED